MGMSTKSAISMEEYLRTSFEDFDREYVDGEIVERALPNKLHGITLFRLAGILYGLAQTRPFFGQADVRSRVAPDRIRTGFVQRIRHQSASRYVT